MPKFTFSHFTRDPNLHNPHLHKTQIYTTPNLHRTQIYMPPDLHHLKFTKPRFTQTQIYTASILHKTQIFTVPKLHRPQFYNTKICIKSSPTFFSLCTMCFITFLDIYLRRPLPNQGGIMSHHTIQFRRVSHALVDTWFE